MTIISKPSVKELSATMTDFVIATDKTINFKVKVGGNVLLDEDYSPDKIGQVRTHRLGDYLAQTLWGEFPNGSPFHQSNLCKTFDFYIDDVQQCSTELLRSCRVVPHIDTTTFLTCGNACCTRPGALEYINTCQQGASVYVSSGSKEVLLGVSGQVTTFDVSFNTVAKILGILPHGMYKVRCNGASIVYSIDSKTYDEIVQFRYKNLFDAPDTINAVGGLTIKGGDKSKTGFLYGVERKFDGAISDEYNCSSGVIFTVAQYQKWHDFLNSREVEILKDGVWYPIIISKQDFGKKLNSLYFEEVKFTFRMADKSQNGVLL